MQRRVPIAEIALIGIAAVWGLTFVMVQDAVERLPVMAFLAYRFIPAALLVAVVFRKELARLPAEGWRAGAWMGIFLFGGYVFQTLGLERTSASNTGFITGLWVVLTPVFGALFLAQKISRSAWLAAAASLVGLFLLSGVGGENANLDGDFLVFLCACSFTGHIFATDRAVKRFDVGALLVVQLGLTGVLSLVIAAVSTDLEMPGSAPEWNALVLTSLFASALGFFIQTYAQKHTSPARTALILASEPAFAGLFAYILADETLSATAWLGAGFILAAIVAVEVVPHLTREPEVKPLERPLPEFD